jgi:hypothetical protein
VVSSLENGHHPNPEGAETSQSLGEQVAAICNDLNIHATLLGVGVDRVDYTRASSSASAASKSSWS